MLKYLKISTAHHCKSVWKCPENTLECQFSIKPSGLTRPHRGWVIRWKTRDVLTQYQHWGDRLGLIICIHPSAPVYHHHHHHHHIYFCHKFMVQSQPVRGQCDGIWGNQLFLLFWNFQQYLQDGNQFVLILRQSCTSKENCESTLLSHSHTVTLSHCHTVRTRCET